MVSTREPRGYMAIVKLFAPIGFILFMVAMAAMSSHAVPQHHYAQLASAMLEGKVALGQYYYDSAFFEGQYYLPLGPLSAVLMVPIAFLLNNIGIADQAIWSAVLSALLVAGCLFMIFRITTAFRFSYEDRCWLVIAFCGASIFLPLAIHMSVWQTAQITGAFFLLAAISEYFHQRRYWVIGLCMGAVLAARTTAVLGIIFFLLAVWFGGKERRAKLVDTLQLLLPLGLAGALLMAYNYVRFHHGFEFGYTYQLLDSPALRANRDAGLFGLRYLPSNLYYFFLAGPLPVISPPPHHLLQLPYLLPNPWGMSIFLTSPYYLYLFWRHRLERVDWQLWVTVIGIALPIFLYYGIGYQQVGYRYALDFLPFLFVIFLRALPEGAPLSRSLKTVFVVSTLVNIYFLLLLSWTIPSSSA